jgi:predicted nucleic acid-binding protein
MSVAVDSSVLVAAVLAGHEHHMASHLELERLAGSDPGPWLPVHALVEAYSVLTRLPLPHRLAAHDARALLQGSFGSWRLAGPPPDIWTFLSEAADDSIVGGTIYDALIIESALSVGVHELLTWNLAHFERVSRRRFIIRTP